MHLLTRVFNEPFPVRAAFRKVIRKYNLGSYEFRYGIGAVVRPQYAYLVYQAARLASALHEPRVSILEFGVAGGAGLLALESHAEEIEKIFPVQIEVYGFDSGAGLPPPMDYRDLPYHWQPGFFQIDVAKLQQRLTRSRLVLGNVTETVNTFFEDQHPAPIGAISFDLDFYSSTVAALRLLDANDRHFLPRMFCYFDDTLGEIEFYSDFAGERLAIQEFNDFHPCMKFSPAYHLRSVPAAPVWHHQIWVLHNFRHPQYNTFVADDKNQQLSI